MRVQTPFLPVSVIIARFCLSFKRPWDVTIGQGLLLLPITLIAGILQQLSHPRSRPEVTAQAHAPQFRTNVQKEMHIKKEQV